MIRGCVELELRLFRVLGICQLDGEDIDLDSVITVAGSSAKLAYSLPFGYYVG